MVAIISDYLISQCEINRVVKHDLIKIVAFVGHKHLTGQLISELTTGKSIYFVMSIFVARSLDLAWGELLLLLCTADIL